MVGPPLSNYDFVSGRQIFMAAFEGDLERLQRLRNEADDGEDFRRLYEFTEPLEGLTCLHFAALRGNIQICRFLIDNVKIDVDFKCHLGYTPLLFAARDRHFNVVKYLIIRGADVKMSDYEGMTCLHMAAILGDIEIMQLLLKGADIEAHSVSGTPLQSAATCGTGNIESIRFLLRRGADVSKCVVSPLSVPPLVLAIQCGSSECLELLLEAGANPNMTWRGLSPLAVAAKEDNTKLIKSLLAAGAEPNNLTIAKMKPIEYAAEVGNLEGISVFFPVTQRISSYREWSINGIKDYFHSAEAKIQRKQSQDAYFDFLDEKGKNAVKQEDYSFAAECFTEAAAATDGDNISLRVSSFACYLDEAKENSVQKVSAEETLNHTKGENFVFNVPKPIKDPIAKFSFSHEAPQKDEISVFGADKYFNTKLKYQYHHNKGRPVNVDRAGPNTGPTNGSSQSKQRKGIIGNILLSRYGWKGPCFNKKDVHVNEIVHRVSKPNRTGSERINHHALDENSTLEEPRDSIEVLGSGITSKGDVAVNMERKLALLTWDAIPKFNENRPTTTCDDMASEADSDLFEIESISRSVYPILAAATTTTAT